MSIYMFNRIWVNVITLLLIEKRIKQPPGTLLSMPSFPRAGDSVTVRVGSRRLGAGEYVIDFLTSAAECGGFDGSSGQDFFDKTVLCPVGDIPRQFVFVSIITPTTQPLWLYELEIYSDFPNSKSRWNPADKITQW